DELMERGVNRHYALVPASEDELIDAWFTLSFGLQQVFALREPVGPDFQPSARDGLTIRLAEDRDISALAELDLVLPYHVMKAPVFSKLTPPTIEEAAAELAEDISNPKYSIFVAEHEGRVIATAVGCDVEVSPSWARLMRPTHAGLLAYAATLTDARGLGAGRALCEAFFVWARDKGYDWLTTDWRSTNIEANRTWRALGFRPLYLRLHRAII
ncbi:MAG TPA: GNAT family N-acetyltransferase, partial [Candidatus Limnocylindrales bacterium]